MNFGKELRRLQVEPIQWPQAVPGVVPPPSVPVPEPVPVEQETT